MLSTPEHVSELIPNQEFAKLASDEQIERTVKALEANGIHAVSPKMLRKQNVFSLIWFQREQRFSWAPP